jgi:arylsulfatase A-like enzyme
MKRFGAVGAFVMWLVGVAIWDSGLATLDIPIAAQAARPRLMVVLVADQLRADYIQGYRHRWRRGLRMLRDEGAWFSRAEYPYLNTATCVGHVTIATGTLPKTHGIVLNRWWHRDEQRPINCTEDESAPDVSYGGPVRFGNSARRVLVPALADELRAQRPGARVVTLALKARAAVPLAGRAGEAVTWFDEGGRTFVTSRAFAAAPVESVAEFIRRDPPEADHGKVWNLHDREETYRHPEIVPGERPKAGWTAVFPHAIVGAAGPDAQYFDRWQKSPFSDAYLARMAMALVDDLQLGQRDATDFLAVSFSALDLMGHDFGTETREVEDMLIRLDATLGALLEHLDARLGRDNYVVALTADHGAAPTPEQSGGGHIASEDIQQLLEQALTTQWGPAAQSPYVSWVGSGSIYFGRGVFDRLRQDGAAMQMVMRTLLGVPGMLRVLRSDEIAAGGDTLMRAAAAGFVAGRTADLLLVPRRNWVIELRAENEATSHGTYYDYDRRVPILLRGHRVRGGSYTARATPADIAPTLAYLAGVTMSKADGRVLSEAIR